MNDRISVYVVDLSTELKPRKFFYFQWVDPVTGRRRTQSSKCTTRRTAERAAKEFEDRLNNLLPRGDGSIDWAKFLELFDREHLQSLNTSSRRRARSIYNVFQKTVAPQNLSKITTGVLSSYATILRKEGRSESTIVAHLSRLTTLLRWAVDRGYLSAVPRMPRVTKTRNRAKGRPLNDDEFVRLLCSVRKIVGDTAAPSWSRLLIGLWLSGLRIEESVRLVWGDGKRHESTLWIDTISGKYPLLGVVAEAEKGNQDRLLPLTPDFGRWLLNTPQHQRTGPVFPLVKRRRKDVVNADHVSKVISEIGILSKVQVNSSGKFASAHDLRRTFGLRWSQRLMPAELQQLMRHADIATTMRFYAMVEAQSFAERLWKNDSTLSTTPIEKS